MRWRQMLAGTCGLSAAAAWATLLVAEASRYQSAARLVAGPGEPIWIRVLVVPSLLQGVAGALLVIPIALAGVAVMLRVNRAAAGLRGMALTGFAAAATVVVAFAVVILFDLGATMPIGLGRAAQLELAGASTLLLLNGATALLLSGPRNNTRPAPAA